MLDQDVRGARNRGRREARVDGLAPLVARSLIREAEGEDLATRVGNRELRAVLVVATPAASARELGLVNARWRHRVWREQAARALEARATYGSTFSALDPWSISASDGSVPSVGGFSPSKSSITLPKIWPW
jgi:hypothetical protein